MPRPPYGLSDEFEEIHEGFRLFAEDTGEWSEITARSKLGQIAAFLRWAPTDDQVGDPFADAEARDRAVGFYKREMFRQGMRPDLINSVLTTLGQLYEWWGLGPHEVPRLEGVWRMSPEPEPEPETAPVSPPPTPVPAPPRVPRPPIPAPAPPLRPVLSGHALAALTWLKRPGAAMVLREGEYVITGNGRLPVVCRGRVVRELIGEGVLREDLSPTDGGRQLGLGQPPAPAAEADADADADG